MLSWLRSMSAHFSLLEIHVGLYSYGFGIGVIMTQNTESAFIRFQYVPSSGFRISLFYFIWWEWVFK